MMFLLPCVLVTFTVGCLSSSTVNPTLPEEHMSVVEIIGYWGYPAEEWTVQTTDGYLLTLHRIPHGKHDNSSHRRPVVFLQHGLEGSSSNWITNLPSQSAGFIFADAGYDVFLGNFRGNTWSKRHAWLPVSSAYYWQFSWDEMASNDLPAMIERALQLGNASTLTYVGHSMGTMTAFGVFSNNQTLASKISTMHALGPVATVGHIKGGLLKLLSPLVNWETWFLKLFGLNQFMPSGMLTKLVAKFICGNKYTNRLCSNIFFQIGGHDSHQLNATRIPVYLAHCPAGTSTQNIQHFGQQVNSKLFQMFDYGNPALNAFHYHQSTPPLYDLRENKVATYLYYGDADTLADPTDVQFIIKHHGNLRNVTELKEFNHLDFIWGMHAPSMVYDKILKVIRSL